MKKHALFAGDNYYPQGGARDFRFAFNSVRACRYYYTMKYGYTEEDSAWAHIVEVKTMEIVWEFEDGEWTEVKKSDKYDG